MSLKRSFIRMAVVGLLVGLTGLMPGAQTPAIGGQAGTPTMRSVSSPGADVARYSAWFQEIEPVRHVLPPPPPIPGLLGGKVSGLEQVLTRARVTVAPFWPRRQDRLDSPAVAGNSSEPQRQTGLTAGVDCG